MLLLFLLLFLLLLRAPVRPIRSVHGKRPPPPPAPRCSRQRPSRAACAASFRGRWAGAVEAGAGRRERPGSGGGDRLRGGGCRPAILHRPWRGRDRAAAAGSGRQAGAAQAPAAVACSCVSSTASSSSSLPEASAPVTLSLVWLLSLEPSPFGLPLHFVPMFGGDPCFSHNWSPRSLRRGRQRPPAVPNFQASETAEPRFPGPGDQSRHAHTLVLA